MMQNLLSELGARIRDQRKNCGLSQEELAYKCGLHRTYIGGIERGERNVSVVNLSKVAAALGVSIASLFPSEYNDQ
jgi:transcriptional regulator with XRE-family HTH domain